MGYRPRPVRSPSTPFQRRHNHACKAGNAECWCGGYEFRCRTCDRWRPWCESTVETRDVPDGKKRCC